MPNVTTSASGPAGGDDDARILRFASRKVAAAGFEVTAVAGGFRLGDRTGEEVSYHHATTLMPGHLPSGASRHGGAVHGRSIIVAAAAWQRLVSAAAVVRKDGGDHWQISAKGRAQLRRLLSAAGAGPDAASGAQRPVRATPQRPGASPDARRPAINPNESPAAWLARRGIITAVQFAAADRLRADFWFAGMSPRVTTNWQAAEGGSGRPPGMASDMPDNVLAATTRVRQALRAVGPELASILIDVCCHLKGLEAFERQSKWPQRSAKVVLDFALTGLARHYGLLAGGRSPARAEAKPRLRHWGGDGYRPSLSGEPGPDAGG